MKEERDGGEERDDRGGEEGRGESGMNRRMGRVAPV